MASSVQHLREEQKSLAKEIKRVGEQFNSLTIQFTKLQESFEQKVNMFGEMIQSWKKADEEIRKEQEKKIVTLRVDLEKFKREIQATPVTPAPDEISYINAQVTYLASDLAEIKYQMEEASTSQAKCEHGEVEESRSMIKKVEEDIVIMKQQSQELRDTVVKLGPFSTSSDNTHNCSSLISLQQHL